MEIEAFGQGEGALGGHVAAVLLWARDHVRLVRLGAGASVVIGRQAPADIEVPDPSLSRQHARFLWDGRALRVVDLGSTNGTHIEGRRVEESVMAPGTEARLGAVSALGCVRQGSGLPSGVTAGGPIIRSDLMADVYATVDYLADANGPVLVHGERGAGKRMVAETLHAQSRRARQPFLVFDCSGPPERLERSLFGAWEEVRHGLPGQLVSAGGGTLYLQSVSSLPLNLQRRLVGAIEEGAIKGRAEGPRLPIEARVVVGDTRPPLQLLADGLLDEALSVLIEDRTIAVPPLRARTAEIRPLAKAFAREEAAAWQVAPADITDDVLDLLEQHQWPGNVQQLREIIELLVLSGQGGLVASEVLPAALQVHQTVRLPSYMIAGAPVGLGPLQPTVLPERDDGIDFRTRVREFEAQLLLEGLRRTGGNQRAASRLLRIPLRTLAHKLKDYDLKRRM